MRLLNQLAAALALVAALAAPAFAADVTDAQKASLTTMVTNFNTAMGTGDIATLTAAVPPKVLQTIADENKLNLDQLKQAMTEQMQQTMTQVKFILFNMDLSQAQYASAADGTPYVLIPTDTQFDAGAQGKFKAHSTTVALLDGSTWYLVRVDDPSQSKILGEAYPAFASIEIPAGTLEPLAQ